MDTKISGVNVGAKSIEDIARHKEGLAQQKISITQPGCHVNSWRRGFLITRAVRPDGEGPLPVSRRYPLKLDCPGWYVSRYAPQSGAGRLTRASALFGITLTSFLAAGEKLAVGG